MESVGKMWDSVWGERGEVSWGVGKGVEKCGEVRSRCGRVHEVSVEGVAKCVEVWGDDGKSMGVWEKVLGFKG